MSGIRMVLVTRRFWPLAGGVERTVANLAQGFLELDASPTVVTAKFDNRWPSDVVCREVPVHRLRIPPRRGWSTMRYMIALSQWLRRNRPDFDLVCVSGLAHEAHAAVGAMAGTNIPVVLRAESDACDDAGAPKLVGRFLRRCQMADAIVVTTAGHESAMIDAGFHRSQVHYIPNGVPATSNRSPSRQAAARASLADVNHDLYVPADMPVAVAAEPLHSTSELEILVDAWDHVAKRWAYARLWLLGDGPHRGELLRRVRARGLTGRVILPGTFDDLRNVFEAADLLVSPTTCREESLALIESMSAGLPVITCQLPSRHQLVLDGVTGRVVPAQDSKALAVAIQTAFEHPQPTAAMAVAAREQMQQSRTDRSMARQHLELFRNVTTSTARRVP